MASTRLNEDNRAEIARSIIQHRYAQQWEAVLDREAKLADLAYREALAGNKIARVEALPKGWLPRVSSIKVAVERPGESPLVMPLFFGGALPGYRVLGRIERPRDKVEKEVPYYLTRDPFMISKGKAPQFLAHYEDSRELQKEIQRASDMVHRELRRFHTTKKLAEGWPEIAEFVKRVEKAPPPPARVPESLNEELGLPPG